jgi:hypothetical protein
MYFSFSVRGNEWTRMCMFVCVQLFKHLDETGHAVPLVQQPTSGKVSKKELRKQRAAAAKKEGRGFGGAVRG